MPGGENMMVRDDGSLRYFTVRESARLQTFPDHFAFEGSWSEAMRQLGNAVPVDLARVVTASVPAIWHRSMADAYNPLDKLNLGKSVVEALLETARMA